MKIQFNLFSFSFKAIFILSELESVLLLRTLTTINLTLLNQSTSFGPTTFDSNQNRLFVYSLVGRQCNGTWEVFKWISSGLISGNSNINECQIYPNGDIIVTEDAGMFNLIYQRKTIVFPIGWRILRIALFTLLGIAVACSIALIIFFVIR